MKSWMFVVAALAAVSCHAAPLMVSVNGAERVTLEDSQGACLPQWQRASYFDGRQTFSGCWTMMSRQRVLIVYEDGDVGEMPAAAFRPPLSGEVL